MVIRSNTGSTIVGPNGENRTSTSISTQILISVGPNTIGAVQNLSINERRTVNMVNEVGTDGSIDSVPTKSAEFSGNCTRVRFDGMRIAEALGRSFVHVMSQRFPFDITLIDRWKGDNNSSIITTLKNCWITSIDYDISADNWIVSDKMSFVAEAISSTFANGPASVGGTNNIPLAIQSPTSDIERAADTGLKRGALDATGLLTAFLPF